VQVVSEGEFDFVSDRFEEIDAVDPAEIAAERFRGTVALLDGGADDGHGDRFVSVSRFAEPKVRVREFVGGTDKSVDHPPGFITQALKSREGFLQRKLRGGKESGIVDDSFE
jgi:hypothetical protein